MNRTNHNTRGKDHNVLPKDKNSRNTNWPSPSDTTHTTASQCITPSNPAGVRPVCQMRPRLVPDRSPMDPPHGRKRDTSMLPSVRYVLRYISCSLRRRAPGPQKSVIRVYPPGFGHFFAPPQLCLVTVHRPSPCMHSQHSTGPRCIGFSRGEVKKKKSCTDRSEASLGWPGLA